MDHSPGHLVLVHGHDDDPAVFRAHATALAPAGWLTSVPTGPKRTPNGASWFRTDDDGDPDPLDVRTALGLLDDELRRVATGLDGDQRLVLAGFSQGAALALLYLLQADAPSVHLDAVIAVAGWLPSVHGLDLGIASASERAGHVLVAHGEDDEVVPFPLGRSVFRLLERAGVAAELLDLPIGHALAPFAAPVRDWIERAG